jgi:hypothetical protein
MPRSDTKRDAKIGSLMELDTSSVTWHFDVWNLVLDYSLHAYYKLKGLSGDYVVTLLDWNMCV